MVDVLIAVLSPLITAGLAALGAMLAERRARKNRRLAWRATLDDATAQVNFIEAWFRIRGQVEPQDQKSAVVARALKDLESAYRSVDTARTVLRIEVQRPSVFDRLRRFAIPPSPSTAVAKVVTVLYYLSWAWFLLAGAVGLVMLIAAPFGGFENSGASYLQSAAIGIGFAFFTAVFGLTPSLVLRMLLTLVGREDARTSRTGRAEAQVTTQPALGMSAALVSPNPVAGLADDVGTPHAP